MNPILVKSMETGGAVPANSLVKFSADYTVVVAAATTDLIIGVSSDIAAASGDRCDVILSGVANVVLGGTVARGEPVTADTGGVGIKAAPAAGVNARIVGYAMISGVSGDIIPVLLSQGEMQTAD